MKGATTTQFKLKPEDLAKYYGEVDPDGPVQVPAERLMSFAGLLS